MRVAFQAVKLDDITNEGSVCREQWGSRDSICRNLAEMDKPGQGREDKTMR